jgi:hypothetical protein
MRWGAGRAAKRAKRERTQDKGDGAAFPGPKTHERAVNAAQERTVVTVVRAEVVVMVVAMRPGDDGTLLIYGRALNWGGVQLVMAKAREARLLPDRQGVYFAVGRVRGQRVQGTDGLNVRHNRAEASESKEVCDARLHLAAEATHARRLRPVAVGELDAAHADGGTAKTPSADLLGHDDAQGRGARWETSFRPPKTTTMRMKTHQG